MKTVTKIIISVVFLGGVTAGTRALASSAPAKPYGWPRHLTSTPFYSTTEVKNPLVRGTLVTPSLKKAACSNLLSVTYAGATGWGIWCLDQLQYPVASSDKGATWRIGGGFLARVGDANAGAEVSQMRALSARVVFAWSLSTLDMTSDGGRHWYAVPEFGHINSVGWSSAGAVVGEIEVTVSRAVKVSPTTKMALYSSTDQGSHWSFRRVQ